MLSASGDSESTLSVPVARIVAAHLLEICLATRAVRDVSLEAIVQLCRERSLEIVGDELDQLLAGELS